MCPILFQWGPITLYAYGFFVALAMITALAVAQKRAAQFGFDKTQIADLLFALFIFGILGARLFYVFQHWDIYQDDWIKIIWIREGGLVWYGGAFGSVVLGTIYARWRGWRVLALCDFFAPIIPLSHAIGRLGCFMNNCCFGKPTMGPWGLHFQGDPHARIATALIEAAALGLLSWVLFRRSARKGRPGDLFLYYLIGYSLIRFFIEFARGDNAIFFNFSLPQWMSLALFFAVLGIKLIEKKRK